MVLNILHSKRRETSLVVHWLRHCTSIAGGMGLIPSLGTASVQPKKKSSSSAGRVDQHTYMYPLHVTWASSLHDGEIPRGNIAIRCYKRI